MRGDRPGAYIPGMVLELFTPHARGSTLPVNDHRGFLKVYPACAGIDPFPDTIFSAVSCLPRMRGDRPIVVETVEEEEEFTPHARGSTLVGFFAFLRILVYPACAGIDPRR